MCTETCIKEDKLETSMWPLETLRPVSIHQVKLFVSASLAVWKLNVVCGRPYPPLKPLCLRQEIVGVVHPPTPSLIYHWKGRTKTMCEDY